MSLTVTIQIEGNKAFMFGSDLEFLTAKPEERAILNSLKDFLVSKSLVSNCDPNTETDSDYNEDSDYDDYDEDSDYDDYDEDSDYDNSDDYERGYEKGYWDGHENKEYDSEPFVDISSMHDYKMGYHEGYTDGVLG